ncbi:MAG: hypothetical protein LIO93_08500 [Bacteroidales bacterium]|nr:hypothetical protein [Bacteroidales bacterium]
MAKFDIKYDALVYMLTPYWLRRPLMTAWLNWLCKPITQLHRTFQKRRENDLFRESIDSTVPRLEYMLNSIFYPEGTDTTENGSYGYRIRIDKVDKQDTGHIYLGGIMQDLDEGIRIYLQDEEQPVYIHTEGETLVAGNDFVVKVPAAVDFDEARMRMAIQNYALPDKTFEITTY